MEKLIFFDIDGTLIRTQSGYLPFNEAIFKTFGVEGDIRTVVPDGNTDPMIVKDIFAGAKVQIKVGESHWRRFAANLQGSYRLFVETGATTIRALPGTLELLQAMCANAMLIPSVVTGNFELTAQVKLEAAGLAGYLCRGAYASDSEHRPDLPAIAKQRWEQSTGRAITAERCVIIGDTPNDLEAARHNRMKCVLVGTGRYPLEELLYWQPDGCLADLVDTGAVVKMLSNL